MLEYFLSSKGCPKSKELVFHNSITMFRYDPCELLNPNFTESEHLLLD